MARLSDVEFTSLVTEHNSIKQQYRLATAVALTVLTGGAVFYHLVEHLSWLDAFYFCTITLTTVGYGDITPDTPAGKLFTIFYVLLGIGIIASFANITIKNATVRRQLKQAQRHGHTSRDRN